MNMRSASPTVSSFSARACSAGSSSGVIAPSFARLFAFFARSTETSSPSSNVCVFGWRWIARRLARISPVTAALPAPR